MPHKCRTPKEVGLSAVCAEFVGMGNAWGKGHAMLQEGRGRGCSDALDNGGLNKQRRVEGGGTKEQNARCNKRLQ
jgi:hypothetical protein